MRVFFLLFTFIAGAWVRAQPPPDRPPLEGPEAIRSLDKNMWQRLLEVGGQDQLSTTGYGQIFKMAQEQLHDVVYWDPGEKQLVLNPIKEGHLHEKFHTIKSRYLQPVTTKQPTTSDQVSEMKKGLALWLVKNALSSSQLDSMRKESLTPMDKVAEHMREEFERQARIEGQFVSKAVKDRILEMAKTRLREVVHWNGVEFVVNYQRYESLLKEYHATAADNQKYLPSLDHVPPHKAHKLFQNSALWLVQELFLHNGYPALMQARNRAWMREPPVWKSARS